MRFVTVLALNIGAAAGYFVARQLMAPEAPPQLARLPEAARSPLLAVRGRLERARARAVLAWQEGRAERDESERDLLREYRERTAWPPRERR